MTRCPRCDGQGRLLKAKIIATGECVIVCDECEAMWFGSQGKPGAFVDLVTYLEGQGIDSAWAALEIEKQS